MVKFDDGLSPISMSSSSRNIHGATKYEKSLGLKTIRFTGVPVGELESIYDCLGVPFRVLARIKENIL